MGDGLGRWAASPSPTSSAGCPRQMQCPRVEKWCHQPSSLPSSPPLAKQGGSSERTTASRADSSGPRGQDWKRRACTLLNCLIQTTHFCTPSLSSFAKSIVAMPCLLENKSAMHSALRQLFLLLPLSIGVSLTHV
jgi:hypothetical protein